MQWLTSLSGGNDGSKEETPTTNRAPSPGTTLAETRRRVEKLRGYHDLARVRLCDVWWQLELE